MAQVFAERRPGGFYVTGSRVQLDSIVREYLDGEEVEAIQAHFATLSLEEVRGAIQFYLDNKAEVEAAMAERAQFDAEYDKTHPNSPEILEKFERMRANAAVRR